MRCKGKYFVFPLLTFLKIWLQCILCLFFNISSSSSLFVWLFWNYELTLGLKDEHDRVRQRDPDMYSKDIVEQSCHISSRKSTLDMYVREKSHFFLIKLLLFWFLTAKKDIWINYFFSQDKFDFVNLKNNWLRQN